MNNKIILNECIAEFKEKNELDAKDDEIMEIFSLLFITNEFDTSYSEIVENIVDGGADGGIDSFIIFINDKNVTTNEQVNEIKFNENTQVKIFISQSKIEDSFKENVLDKLHISLPFILDLELEEDQLLKRFNPRLVEKITLFRDIWKLSIRKKSKFNLNFTYSCKAENNSTINGAFRSKIDQIIKLTKDKIASGNINFDLYSSKELIDLYSKPQHSELELKFKETPMPVSGSTIEENGFIGVVLLRDYYNFIVDEEKKIKEYLFESNIRHYQGDTADVNQKIAETLQNDLSRDFWWLNNGITIIASECRPVHKTLFLDDVQIVNGLQTSYTISKFYNNIENEDNRSILVKVIKSTNKETIDNIIFATNSQTAVSATLLRATSKIHRNLEVIFNNKGYFYDRRKNYYKNHGQPANKIFSIQDTAQAVETILNFEPAIARSKPTTLIKEDSSYEKIFNQDNLESFLNCCLLHQKVKNFISKMKSTKEKNSTKNFSFHISRILASILTSKNHYSSDDIKNLNVEALNYEDINKAYKLLEDIILVYRNENPDENIINIAKSSKFIDSIELRLEYEFFDPKSIVPV